jgi:hypothetical protein
MTTATLEKSIVYSRADRDYKATLGGELIGFFREYHTADVELDRLILDRLLCDLNGPASATALDGAQSEALNWTDRPQPWEADPPNPGPSDGTGLGDRGSEGDDPDAGRAIARFFHRDPRAFVRTLPYLSLDDHNAMAEAYSRYMRLFNPAMTPPHALHIWGLACVRFLV